MTTLQRGWLGFGLEPYRDCHGTYCYVEAERMPPLPALDGSFAWLASAPRPVPSPVEHRTPPPPVPDEPGLPPEFVHFVSHPELMAAVPSCTACYWSVAPTAVPSPLDDGARLLRFLSDQQDVLHWYLWLAPDGGHRVLCGPIDHHEDTVTPEVAQRNLLEVGPSFEAFLYRFWVENLAWFELNDARLRDSDRTPAVAAYLASM